MTIELAQRLLHDLGDSGPVGPLSTAVVVNLLLIAVFGIQHTVMARPTFKRWWKKFVPAPIERSTYVLLTNLALILLFWQWRPTGGVVWDVENTVARIATLSPSEILPPAPNFRRL